MSPRAIVGLLGLNRKRSYYKVAALRIPVAKTSPHIEYQELWLGSSYLPAAEDIDWNKLTILLQKGVRLDSSIHLEYDTGAL